MENKNICRMKHLIGPSLQYLELSGARILNFSSNDKLPALKAINISNCDIEGILQILTTCPSVETLSIRDCSPEIQQKVFKSQLPMLKQLEFQFCEPTLLCSLIRGSSNLEVTKVYRIWEE